MRERKEVNQGPPKRKSLFRRPRKQRHPRQHGGRRQTDVPQADHCIRMCKDGPPKSATYAKQDAEAETRTIPNTDTTTGWFWPNSKLLRPTQWVCPTTVALSSTTYGARSAKHGRLRPTQGGLDQSGPDLLRTVGRFGEHLFFAKRRPNVGRVRISTLLRDNVGACDLSPILAFRSTG